MQTLNDTLNEVLKSDLHNGEVMEIILNNLKEGYGRRPYQLEALRRFVFYFENPHLRARPTQLLFHMATGSGKTLVMAGCMLYLYHKGYRNFVFFVNSTNIIGKTRDNFLNPATSKYLFSNNIVIGNRHVRIREVANFDEANVDDINITFSTIQGLHTRLNTPKENSITYNDFVDNKIVLISDEAHHINAETKKGQLLSKEESEEAVSWEGTVNRIFKTNKDNILLEFTATADLSNPDTARKYKDKLLFDYPLKQFRDDGYSKEVKVLQADLPLMERVIQAVVLSQYRRKVFEKNRIRIKPVVLFKSRSIKESQVFQLEFSDMIRSLKPALLQKIRKHANPVLRKAFDFFDENKISIEHLVIELRNDFAVEKCISVNSKEESEAKQIAVNTLEDTSNEYRAVFAVDKLNEGWDVLNLFDIVRLYDTRDAMKGQPGKTTMSEAQLIGRGARYCPFGYVNGQSAYLRKFDADTGNEMRICEELYYHSAYNPRYIAELSTALEEIGMKEKSSIEVELKLKASFKQSEFYKTGFVLLNERKKKDHSGVFSLQKNILDTIYSVSLKTGYTKTSNAFGEKGSVETKIVHKEIPIISFGVPVIRKAIDKLEFYTFSNLSNYFPNLRSIIEFITSAKYLGRIKVEVKGTSAQAMRLSQEEKLEIAISVLERISQKILSDSIEFSGTEMFQLFPVRDQLKERKLSITVENGNRVALNERNLMSATSQDLDLAKKDWFVFGDHFSSIKEKLFIEWFDKMYEKLRSDFSEIYLVRNESCFKFYNYEDGKTFHPDYLLCMTRRRGKLAMCYQVLIDLTSTRTPKSDKWKEDFLKGLFYERKVGKPLSGLNYRVLGISIAIEELESKNFQNTFLRLVE